MVNEKICFPAAGSGVGFCYPRPLMGGAGTPTS
jgi:hypothetical protein